MRAFSLSNLFHHGIWPKNKDLQNHSVILKCEFQLKEQLITPISTNTEIFLKVGIISVI